MAITSKGKAWERRHSIWMLWAILTMGFLNYVSFFYAASRVKQRKWFYAGVIYSIIFIVTMVATEFDGHWIYDASIGVFLIGWIVSIFHVFKIRPEYLLRLEAKQAPGYRDKDIQLLKEQIKREYSGGTVTVPREETAPRAAAIKEERAEETMGIVDVNTASEAQIARVPGIGALFSKRVVEMREQENGFTSFDHFVEALSIRPHVAEKIRPHLSFPEKSNPAKPESSERREGRIVDF
ncbi:ComEA family DNA-binding protein [Siminovitchia sediminis]|uniref:ComEA family DNA-binding protein n=1 Tax=Siminovitchia sediminis TaxID=1274353 RepID=A0ABW4KD36_9BACI